MVHGESVVVKIGGRMGNEGIVTLTAYCMKCKKRREVLGIQVVKTKTGRRMGKGTCAKCGGKVSKFLKKK